jgi:hypothetical protein
VPSGCTSRSVAALARVTGNCTTGPLRYAGVTVMAVVASEASNGSSSGSTLTVFVS